jgi:tRNA 2-thiouridine synthesizing protein A
VSETFVDARGLKCPWPALRLAKAMREAARIKIAADDPQAPAEFRALCAEHGWSIAESGADFVITRGE